MKIRSLRYRILTLLLLSSYLMFTYNTFDGWWYSSIGTLLVLFFSYLIWGKNFPDVTGLRLSVKTILTTLMLTVTIIACSVIIISYIGSKNGVTIHYTNFGKYYHNIFYILNEEIILGGITIYLLLNKYKIAPLKASVGLALVFSLIHFVFYKWIFLETGIIKVETLIVLCLVGFLRNNLIIIFGHIGYSWALHFGWMVVMFGSAPSRVNTFTGLSEPERFNMFLGSFEMLALTGILAGISLGYMIKKMRSIMHHAGNTKV
ncbi:MAG TPA: hypothetical protein ENH59_10055 [Bacteroidetes bacterium]|nr:hypothetical protein [Bacteroidota bacterium]